MTIVLCLAVLLCCLPPGLPQEGPSSGVQLYSELENRVLPNNTILSPGDIGTSSARTLLCSTARDDNMHGGRWRDPNGDELETRVVDDALYSLVHVGALSIIRGSAAAFDSVGVEGVYRCRIRDETNTFRNLYAGIYRTSSFENSNGPVVRDPIAFTLLTDLLSPTPSFSLNCTSHSFPPTELSWSRDEQPLPLSEAPYQSNQQLRDALSTTYDNLLTVSGSLPGLYNCTATNERGSQSNTLNVTMPPGPPTNVMATIQGRNRVRVSWTAPGDALGYLILHQLGGGSESEVRVEDPGATEHTIELTGEGEHTITMLAYALLPNPTRSEAVVVTFDLPGPPTITQVSPVESTGLRVSWTPPPDDALEGFHISYTPVSDDCLGILGGSGEVDGGGAREGTVRDLVGGTEYNVTVSARNGIGYSPPSAGVTGTTSEAAPSAPPLSVVPTAVDASTIRITWEPPACETWNSETITSYVIQNDQTGPTPVNNPALRSFTISNLPTFTEYSVRMAAVNSAGEGPFSESTTIVLVDAPGQVQSLSSSPNILSVTLSWQPPSEASGFITGYRVSHRLTSSGSGGALLDTAEVGADVTSFRLTGLVPETQYTILVGAATSAGEGDTATTTETTTNVGQVQNVAVRSLSAVAVNVTWSRDSDDISSFRVYFSASGGGRSRRQSPASPAVFPGNASWGVIDGLRSEVQYQFQVAAVIVFPGLEREGLRSQAVSVGGMSTSSDSNVAAIAGGIIGAAIFVLLVIIIVIFLYTVWNRKKRGGKFTISNSIDLKPRSTPLPLPDFDSNPGSNIPSSRPMIEEYPKDTISIEGERVVFSPKFTGCPQPSICWYHEGCMIASDYSMTLDNSGKLTIVCVEPRHAGNYRFTVSNSSGSVQGQVNLFVRSDSDDVPLTEKGAPAVESVVVDVANFGAYIAEKHGNNNRGFRDQFLCLDPKEAGREWMIASLPDNRLRNRFKNITPFDDNRVALKAIGSREDCQHDYINASYIDGYYIPKKFIATQGPLANTVIDFWRMVSQLHCPSIVMITNVKEGSKVKCEQYWPDSVSETLEFGPFKVTLTEQHVLADYTIRNLLLSLTTKSHTPMPVTQYHFTAWPDHGVPDYATSMVNFHRRVKSSHKPAKGPMLIHCSAGVGRTGTFIALDVALEQASNEDRVDVPGIITKIRGKRMKMVQTQEQYVFIHDAVLEALVCGDTQIPASKLHTTMDHLLRRNPRTQMTGYQSQFHVLNQVTPRPEESPCTTAMQSPEKNRLTNYLPTDRWRVVLKAEHPDYIHASFANGYKQKKAYIIAQGPMENTSRDFWKMVYERNCCAIVMLSGVTEKGQEVCHCYWPAHGMERYGEFAVSSMQETKHDGFVERIFSITDSKSGQTHRVSQFQVLEWGPDGSGAPAAVISTINCVTILQRRSGNTPIVVHCSDTVGRSGVFCCVMSAIEACKTESILDVFQVAKALRIQKPGAVPTVEQYQFIHELLLVFLENFANYSNFK